MIPVADKMQPGRFTLRFNMNDPQQQAAVDILNRMGRQKAQFIAQALIHYTKCKGNPQTGAPGALDERTLEQVILSVLARHPEVMASEPCEDTAPASEQAIPRTEQTETLSSVLTEEGLSAISKTLSAFRNQ